MGGHQKAKGSISGLTRSLGRKHFEAGPLPGSTVRRNGYRLRKEHLEQSESVPSGVYFYRLDAGDFAATRKMVVVK